MSAAPKYFPMNVATPGTTSRADVSSLCSKRDPSFATTLANGLAILESFRTTQPALTNKDLVEITGLSKGTISRLTHTLIDRGLLVQESRTRCYRLGAGILAIAYPLLANLRVRQIARPYMQELARQTGATVSMGIYDRAHMVYVETVRVHDLQAFRPEIGARVPIAMTAMGRAWYAQAVVNKCDTSLAAFKNSECFNDEMLCEQLERACADLQKNGYCSSLGAWHPDVHAVAAPLPSEVDGQRLIFNCGVKTSLLGEQSVQELCGEKLLDTINKVHAAVISAQQTQAQNNSICVRPSEYKTVNETELFQTDHQSDSQFAMTLANGIDVLASFQHNESALGNKDFAQRTGLSPSTIVRLTYTLEKLGYLRRIRGKAKYGPGFSLLTTAYPLLAGTQLRQLARPLMRELAETVNGAVSLVIEDRCRLIFVETSRANEALPTHPDIGSSMPLLSTAAGKAWLCQAAPDVRERTLNQLKVRNRQEYDAYFPLFTAAQREFSETGCCSNQSQWRKDVYGFAIPLGQPGASMVYVFNCGVPSKDGEFEKRRQEIIPLLLTLVRRIETFLEH